MRTHLVMMTLAIAAAACARKTGTTERAERREPTPPVATVPPTIDETVSACPTDIEGTTVSVIPAQDSVAVLFETTGDLIDLRARVHKLSDLHRSHAGMTQEEHRGHPGMEAHAGMPAADIRVEDTANGARIVFTPQDLEQMSDLEQHLAAQAKEMQAGQCPRMPMAQATE